MPVELTGRHLDLGQPPSEPWHCPACAAINAGDIAAGCASCGSGSVQARKAPILPTPPRPDPRDPLVLPPAVDAAGVVADRCDQWLARFPDADRLPPSVRAWIVDAFHAGWVAARQQSFPTDAPVQVPMPDLPFPVEGKVARTLAVALRQFLENVLVAADDEIAAGEWCSVADAEALIRQLDVAGANPYHG